MIGSCARGDALVVWVGIVLATCGGIVIEINPYAYELSRSDDTALAQMWGEILIAPYHSPWITEAISLSR